MQKSIYSKLVIFVALLFISCANTVESPVFEPEISNTTDSFEFQATDVENVSQTVEYTWANTGTQANINQATTATSGAAMLTVKDSDGNTVYQKDLEENGSFVSGAGTSGNWKVILTLSDHDGTLNFSLEKRTP